MSPSAPASPVCGEDLRPMPEEGAKRRQILDGARAVFLRDGFDAASMNEIARVAGVSKGTLYVYFASKAALFADLIRDEKREQAEQTCAIQQNDTDVAGVLRGFGERLLDRMFRDTAIAHLRTVIAVAPRFPEIGRAFFEAGPLYGHARLRDYFVRQVELGTLNVDAPDLAAWFFLDLCKSCFLVPILLNVADRPAETAIRTHVAAVVAMFMRAYPAQQLRQAEATVLSGRSGAHS